MIQRPKKPCVWCAEDNPTHWPYQCFKNPKKGKYQLNSFDKGLGATGAAKKWNKARRRWFQLNNAESYTCYICGKYLLPIETTLDHVIPRSRAPDLRYDLSNLKPCCWKCNTEKGSKVL